jgi:S-adenosylmethionine synthetase
MDGAQFHMAIKNYVFTSESVSEGHPDKVCDRISDEIVDLFYREALEQGFDPRLVRVACETLATTNRLVIAGETRGPTTVTPEKIEAAARRAIKDIGYTQAGFHWETVKIEILLHSQSADIAQGVDSDNMKDEGAGDQGIMFGYACDETPELMPAPIYYAQRILKLLAEARHSGKEPALGPDSKSQVSVQYKNGKPVGVTQIVVSHQHIDESLSSADVRKLVEPYVKKALPKGWITKDTVWHVNPTGKFFIGGPDGDAGLTGRKIIVDTYGGGRACQALLHPAFLCHRRGPTLVDLRRYFRNRKNY